MAWEPWFRQENRDDYEFSYINKPSLAEQMASDEHFMELVAQGEKDIEEGRYSTLEEVKARLGD